MNGNVGDELYRDFFAISSQQASSLKDAAWAYRELAARVMEFGEIAQADRPTEPTPARSTAAASDVLLQGPREKAPTEPTSSEVVRPANTPDAVQPASLADLVRAANPAKPAAVETSATGTMSPVLAQPLKDMVSQIQTLRTQTMVSTIGGTVSNDAGGGVLDTVLGLASTVLKTSLSPILRGLIGLFTGGDDTPEPAPLTKYALPASVKFQGATTPGGIASVDYDQAGLPRAYREGDGASTPSVSAPQITVNVQAMDARSFLDHSNEIAAAVREAMLNLNSINDVVADL